MKNYGIIIENYSVDNLISIYGEKSYKRGIKQDSPGTSSQTIKLIFYRFLHNEKALKK